MRKFIFSFAAATFFTGVFIENLPMVIIGIAAFVSIIVIDYKIQNHG